MSKLKNIEIDQALEGEAPDLSATQDNRERRKTLKCSFCPPNRGENRKSGFNHGKTKAKYKDKRKGK